MKKALKRFNSAVGIVWEEIKTPTVHECVYYKTLGRLPPLPKQLRKKFSDELQILSLAYEEDNEGGNELDSAMWTPLHRYLVFRNNVIHDDDLFFSKLLSITSKKNLLSSIPFSIVSYLLSRNHSAHPKLLKKLLEDFINDLDISFFFNSLDYGYPHHVLIYNVLLPRLEFATYVDPVYGITCVVKVLWKFHDLECPDHLVCLLAEIYPKALSIKCEPRFSSLPFTMALQRQAAEETLLKIIEIYPEACSEIDLHGNTTLHILIKNKTLYKSVIYQICEYMPNAIHMKNKHGQTALGLTEENDVDVEIIRSLKRILSNAPSSDDEIESDDCQNVEIENKPRDWHNIEYNFFKSNFF